MDQEKRKSHVLKSETSAEKARKQKINVKLDISPSYAQSLFTRWPRKIDCVFSGFLITFFFDHGAQSEEKP